jgi:hypothetical protein
MGVILAPLGFGGWLAMQTGMFTRFLLMAFGPQEPSGAYPPYHSANVVVATLGFLSFLAGMYFLAFSKEKIEDEMVQRTRLDSFQFAALVQLIFIIAGFLAILVLGDPSEGILMLFFIAGIFLFWLCFISRFNYILHVKLRS